MEVLLLCAKLLTNLQGILYRPLSVIRLMRIAKDSPCSSSQEYKLMYFFKQLVLHLPCVCYVHIVVQNTIPMGYCQIHGHSSLPPPNKEHAWL